MYRTIVLGLLAALGWLTAPGLVASPVFAAELVLIEAPVSADAGSAWREHARVVYQNEHMLILIRDASPKALPAGAKLLTAEAVAGARWLLAHAATPLGRDRLASLGPVRLQRDALHLIELRGEVPEGFSLQGIHAVLPLTPAPLTETGWRRAMAEMAESANPATVTPAPGALTRNSDVQEIVDQIDEGSYQGMIQSLENFVTRNARTSQYHDACLWARNTLESYGLAAEIQEFWADAWWGEDFLSYNVVAEQPGVEYPEQVYIICGHLDSTAGSTHIPESVAPGADDNASGSGGAIEAARVMSQYSFAYTIRYICFGAEEMGLCGSYAYAQAAAQAGEQILGVINFDMILYDGDFDGGVYMPYDNQSQPLAQAFADAAAMYVPALDIQTEYNPGSSYSDHYPFWVSGYPAILGIEDDFYGNPYYHTTSDLLANYESYWPFGTQCLKAGVATLATLAQPVFVNDAEDYVYTAPTPGLELRWRSPNPVGAVARLSLAQPIAAPVELSLLDASGRLILTRALPAQERSSIELPTQQLPNGVFWLRAAGPLGTAETRLLKVR